MKIFVIGLVLAFVSASHQGFVDMAKETSEIIDECISESNADPATVEEFLDKNTISDDDNFKCFLNCFASSITLLKASGDIDFDILKAVLIEMGLKPEESNVVVEACAEVTGGDGCEIAYNLVNCISENIPE